MKKTLYLLSGLPGSGKSTYAAKLVATANPETAIWHSRDKIRFKLLDETDNYFEHEDEVINLWHQGLQESLDAPYVKYIIADATHLTDRSRNRTLSGLKIPTGTEVINVVFDVPLEECLRRNALRTGRERVSEKVIKRMWRGFHMPDNGYRTVIVYQDGKELGSIE